MFKHTAIAAAVVMAAGAQASDYQFDIGGQYGYAERDPVQADTLSLDGAIYFNPVSTEDHVLGEAAFLQRASNLRIGLHRDDTDQSDQTFVTGGSIYTRLGNDRRIDAASAKAEFYLPGDLFYIGVASEYQDWETNSFSDSDTQWSASFGVTPVEGLLVYGELYEHPDDRWGLGAKYVDEFLGSTVAVNARYDYDAINDILTDKNFSMDMDYYLDRTLSVGLGFKWEERFSDDSSLDTYQINARKFFTQDWSLSASVGKRRGLDQVTLGTRLRF